MNFTFLDGSMGVYLIKNGYMPSGCCVEKWLLENPAIWTGLLNEYADAGSDIVYAPTFESISPKLARHGIVGKTVEINRDIVAIAKQAVGGKAKVFGDMSTSGGFVTPVGELTMERLVEYYSQQAEGFVQGGADGAAIETQISAADFRAAAIACKKVGLPFLITVTVDGNGRMLSGCNVACAALMAKQAGAFAFGMNCCNGPQLIAAHLGEARAVTDLPLVAKPNAGVPDDSGRHNMTPEDFAAFAPSLVESGASILGGCCGTDPRHIRALTDICANLTPPAPAPTQDYVCSQSIILPKQGLKISEPIPADDELAYSVAELDGDVAACVKIDSEENLAAFIEQAPLIRAPLVFDCADEKLRETALLYYNGVTL